MKRRLAAAGLPIEPASMRLLPSGEHPKPVAPTRPAAAASAPQPSATQISEPEVIQIDPETGKYIGRLKWYNPSRGYGFISRGGGEDIFFHKTSVLVEPTEMEEGQWVLYDVEERSKGPEAMEIEPYEGELP
jgi:CspA family cold shock protein